MAVFEEEGIEKILTYETQTPYDSTMLIVPAMTVKQDRLKRLYPEWVESAKRLGVQIKVICLSREDIDISDFIA